MVPLVLMDRGLHTSFSLHRVFLHPSECDRWKWTQKREHTWNIALHPPVPDNGTMAKASDYRDLSHRSTLFRLSTHVPETGHVSRSFGPQRESLGFGNLVLSPQRKLPSSCYVGTWSLDKSRLFSFPLLSITLTLTLVNYIWPGPLNAI